MANKVKLIGFDVDDTLTLGNSWESLNLALGMTKKEDSAMLSWYREGVISYDQWIEIALSIYKKRSKPNAKTINSILSNYKLRREVKPLIKYLKARGYEIGLVSGAIHDFVGMVAKDLDVKHFQGSSRLQFDNTGSLLKINHSGNEADAKLNYLIQFCKQLKLKITDCAYIGDGANDLKIFKATKKGITFKNSSIRPYAWKTIKNLSEVKKIF